MISTSSSRILCSTLSPTDKSKTCIAGVIELLIRLSLIGRSIVIFFICSICFSFSFEALIYSSLNTILFLVGSIMTSTSIFCLKFFDSIMKDVYFVLMSKMWVFEVFVSELISFISKNIHELFSKGFSQLKKTCFPGSIFSNVFFMKISLFSH